MSGEAKHTPGPWAVVVGDDDDVTVCSFDGEPRDGIMSDVICEITSMKDMEDAHLIAAAPDLLEAAQAHIAARDALHGANVNTLTQDDPRFAAVSDTLDALKAAIAKARGETP